MNTIFSTPTDKSNKVRLDSKILYALWGSGIARGGAEVPIEVKTLFVGNGADIEIIGKSSKGKAPGKLKGKIFNNRFTASLPIPEKVNTDAFVWFEAKLPKHGLKMKSNEIPAGPPIICTRMQWDRKEVRRGEVVKLSAQFEGVRGDEEALVRIFEYDRDGNHDPIVTIPTCLRGRSLQLEWEYQYYEDTDEIPTNEEMKKYGKKYNPPEYFFVVIIDCVRMGEKQQSGLLTFKDYLRVELKDADGNPAPNEKYTILLADGTEIKGKLNAEGFAEFKDIPPGVCITIFPDKM